MLVHRSLTSWVAVLSLLLGAKTAFSQTTQPPSSQPVEVYVWGQQPTSAATEQTRWSRDLELRPTNTPSAGMGFDEEALKAVRQFRFEPARKDGKNIPSESTYIYRFRLEK